MPNGFHGSKKKWRRLEAPLVEIDAILLAFAKRYGLEVYRNYRGADRSLRFNDALSRTIWVYASEKYGASGTYDVSIVAYQDRPERYVKSAWLARRVPSGEMERMLEQAAHVVASWSENDLELVAYEGEERERMLADRFRESSALQIWAAWIKHRVLAWIDRLVRP